MTASRLEHSLLDGRTVVLYLTFSFRLAFATGLSGALELLRVADAERIELPMNTLHRLAWCLSFCLLGLVEIDPAEGMESYTRGV